MQNRFIYRLVHDEARNLAAERCKSAPDGWIVEIKPSTRTLEQNARLWAMLSDISKQVDWYGRKLSSEEWKCVFSAGLKRQDVVPGMDGGFVVLGQSTSKMSRTELSSLIDLISAFGSQHNVVFKEN